MQDDEGTRLLLGNYLNEDGIALDLKSSQRDEILEELVDLIGVLRDKPDARQKLLSALQAREELCSTGVGDGVAIPHARNAMVGLVKEPVIVFGRKVDGVSFDSVDAIPVKLFFLVVAPNVTTHLRILSRLSRLLRDPHLRNNLLTAEHASRVLSLIKVNEVNLQELPSH
jgi:mannitol/fructose-specific phosphotransferase system IIA component (Ntr-type)